MDALSQPARMQEPVHVSLWILVGFMVILHGLETAAAAGWVSPLFGWFYMHSAFGFFDPYFDAAMAGEPYPTQVYWSLITHGFLHGSWLHLAMNGAILLAVGHGVCRMAGATVMLVAFFCSVIMGAVTLGLMTETKAVLVGASGGVFGLLGLLLSWRARMMSRMGFSAMPVWRVVLALVVIHLFLIFGFESFGEGGLAGGNVAWQAHLGGFVAGWGLSYIYSPTRIIAKGPPSDPSLRQQ
ncbi:MAG: rhomboid family intramembrane serine protease [Pseudomonadota bacterium]